MVRNTPTAAALMACLISSCSGFSIPQRSSSSSLRPTTSRLNYADSLPAQQDIPFFLDRIGSDTTDPLRASASSSSVAKKSTRKADPQVESSPSSKHKSGVFSPIVLGAKAVLGPELLNQVRGKAIGLHSEVIAKFVDTYETPSGQVALKVLFDLADQDKSGTISRQELATAIRVLGFEWLEDKQIDGIFARADKDGNGMIGYDEFVEEAPKTLRTNLKKLAKKNGGDMGLLV
jgi:hypothetical protein